MQDLINHLGSLLGFVVQFGRYAGISGKNGVDGVWVSQSGLHIAIEVKTTNVYAVKTATLLNYINDLISEKTIPPDADVLGLYVFGRPDPELSYLHAAIIGEKKADRLRIISAESLLSVAELIREYDITHQDILALLKPSTPSIDPIVDLITRLVAEEKTVASTEPLRILGDAAKTQIAQSPFEDRTQSSEPAFWLTPVKPFPEESAEECIRKLVAVNRIYAFGENTAGRKRIKPGDRIAFYSNGKGVVAHAIVDSFPENKPHKAVRQNESYPWVFRVTASTLYLDEPVVIDAARRAMLDAFRGKDLNKGWAWFVQGTGSLTEHDFRILTRDRSSS